MLLHFETGHFRHHPGPRRWNVDNETCTLPPHTTAMGVSVVVPTIGKRTGNLRQLALSLLSSTALQHEASELLISHASNASWEGRAAVSTWLREHGARNLSQRLVHVDERARDATLGVASRFFTALAARNEVTVQLDDVCLYSESNPA